MSGRCAQEFARGTAASFDGDDRVEAAFARRIGDEIGERRLVVDQQQPRLLHSANLPLRHDERLRIALRHARQTNETAF